MNRMPIVGFILLAVLAAGPALAVTPDYAEGGVYLNLTDLGAKYGHNITLPAGNRFSQVALDDIPGILDTEQLPVAARVYNSIGMSVDITLALGGLSYDTLEGSMLISGHMASHDGSDRFWFTGTGSLGLEANGNPYVVDTVVIGDQSTLYIVGWDSLGTADTADDRLFLVRCTANLALLDVGIPVVGNARLHLLGGAVAPLAGALTTVADPASLPFALPVDAPYPAGTQFTQVYPVGDPAIDLDGDTPAEFVADISYLGTFNGGPLSLTWEQFTLTGGTFAGRGKSFGRFEWKGPGGGYLQGFVFGDTAPDAGQTTVESHVLALAGKGGREGFFLGSLLGSIDSDGLLSGTIDGNTYAAAAVSPEALTDGGGNLVIGSFHTITSLARDLNGWTDLSAVQLKVAESAAGKRILARYTPVTDRLYLFDPALGRWVGGCRPGSVGILRNRFVRLSCANTVVSPSGETLRIDWSLLPTPLVVPGGWNSWLKVTDRSAQSAGWRLTGENLVSSPPD